MTVKIERFLEAENALMRYNQKCPTHQDTRMIMDAVEYVKRALLPKSQYSKSLRDDFGQDLLCHLWKTPSHTLQANLEQRGFNAVMFYHGKSVKSELVRKAPVVALPRRRKKDEISRNQQMVSLGENLDDAKVSFTKERTRSHLRLIQSKADPQTASAMAFMMNTGADPKEAAKHVDLSRPTLLRRLEVLGRELAA